MDVANVLRYKVVDGKLGDSVHIELALLFANTRETILRLPTYLKK